MSFDFSSLEVHIRQILTSPGIDLGTISAKGVRKKLISLVPALTPEFLKQNRKGIDEIIAEVYTQVKAESGLYEPQDDYAEDAKAASDEGSSESRKRKHKESDEDEDEDVEDTHPAKKSKKEEEGEEAGTTKARKTRNSAAKKGGRSKKSSATVDSGAESEEGGGKKKRSRKKSTTGEGGGAKGGFAKEFMLSEPLAKVLGTEKLSRPQVVKQLWAYIKEKELQNPQNRREILLDDNLKAVFGGEKIGMFSMNKVLGNHLLKD
ncbi:hypothetical protein AX15_006840 [Amanita polypyramis BW_CC]|nr:hypothetical protein AX15_006840 [Amanita polypyramis BW_CC]